MKKRYLLSICIFLFFNRASAQNTWTQKANFSGPVRMGAVGFGIGSKGYIGIGGDFSSIYYDDFWEYDPVTDSWTQKANFAGGARYRAIGFAAGNKGYIGTGYNGSNYNDFWEYDPGTNTWTQKALIGNMTRFGSTGFTIGNKIFTGTGTGNSGYMKDFWEYDILLNAWTQKADFGGQPKIYAVGFAVGANGYIGTGVNLGANPLGSKDFWEYDTTANTWNQKADLPGAVRSEAVGFAIGNYGYIGTGSSNWGVTALDDFWKYNPVTDSWVQVASFGGGLREEATAFVVDCKAYVGTGFINDVQSTLNNDLWEYTPDSACYTGINFTASNTVFCENECIDFTDLSNNSPFAWQWFFPGANTTSSNNQNPTNICYANSGNYDVTLIACNAQGCDTLVFQNYIHVSALPTLSIGPDTVICTGDSILLDAGPGFSSYLWNNGATTQTIFASTQGIYVVQISSVGCDATDTLIVTVQNCASTIALFSCSDTLFCDKKCIDFTDLSTNNPTSWQWYFPGADSTTSNVQNPTNICYNSYGSFDVTLIACNASGCDTLFIPGFINEFQGPAVPVITSNFDTLFSTPAYSYQWYFNASAITGATNQYYVYQQQGNYYVIITDSNGCATSSNSIFTAIDESNATSPEIKVIPNPSDGNFLLNLAGFKRSRFEIKIYDELGRLIMENHTKSVSTKFSLKLPDGSYFIEVKADGKIYRKKILVNLTR